MAITMQVTLRRVGEYAQLWADGRTDWTWSEDEDAVLRWLERRYGPADLRVILERTEVSIEQRQQSRQPIAAASLTTTQALLRFIAAVALQCERFAIRWTQDEDAVLRWLADRYSIADLQVILRRPMGSIERRLRHLRVGHPGLPRP